MPRTNSLVKREETSIEASSSEDNAEFVQNFLSGLNVKKVDLLSLEDCQNRVIKYAYKCQEDNIPIGNQGLCYHLGLTRQTFEKIVDGRYPDKKVSPKVRDYFRQVWQGLAANRESLAAKNKLSAPIAIFWQKNYDKMEDKTTVQSGPIDDGNDKLSIEEIQKTLQDNLPDMDEND